MPARRYRPLAATVALTAIITAALCFVHLSWCIKLDSAGSRWLAIATSAGSLSVWDIRTTGVNMTLWSSATLYRSPPDLLPRYASSPLAIAGTSVRSLTLPLWTLAAPVLLWQYARARRTRPGPGQCPRCAYDMSTLTATTCPECGGPIQHPAPPPHDAGRT